jgi:hypothetical protein
MSPSPLPPALGGLSQALRTVIFLFRSNSLMSNAAIFISFPSNPLKCRIKHVTLNQRVQGSSPCAPTSKIVVWRREIIALTTRGNPWGNGSAAWCDELESRTGKSAGGQALRTATYPHLVPIANQWHERMHKEVRFPEDHAKFLGRCHKAGQVRPTPLLLEYAPDDYNCLHRDLYGEHVFPIRLVVLLDQPDEDFRGGEFVMTEQRPRMQTRAMVLPLNKGDAAFFAVNSRPMKGVRGDYQVKLNHGVSKLYSGKRHTVGVIFHDAT